MKPSFESGGRIPQGTVELLQQIGYAGEFLLIPLSGGANNRVYRIDGLECPMVLKSFYHVDGDHRDRFAAEKAFYDYLRVIGLPGTTPSLLASSSDHRLGIFTWIEGQKLTPSQVDEETVGQALRFYLELNAHRDDPTAQKLPIAAEACFTLEEHLRSVERRMQRLETLIPRTDLEHSVSDLVRIQLRPLLNGASETLKASWPAWVSHRAISPSDFGFHNALRNGSKLVFFDFEYAGWDDSLKFICDFLCQPEIPVPPSLHPFCLDLLPASRPGGVDPEQVRHLLPLYRLKWICLVLNEFLPAEQQRRVFSRELSPEQLAERQQRQFHKAQSILETFSESR